MTTFSFKGGASGFTGFSAEGHSSADCDDDEGKIVCSAVSSALYLTANTLTEVFSAECDIDISDAYFTLMLKAPDKAASKLIKGLYLHIGQLQQQYPERIRIITEV